MNKLFAIAAAAILVSCKDSGEVYMRNINGAWHKKDKATFSFPVRDVQNPKNLIFIVRNNNDYPYSNIRLIVDFHEVKSKKKITDTLNYILARPDGEWIGTGFGETKETLFQYRLRYRFPKQGQYSVTVQQAMRQEVLKGIEDIGIKIENIKP